MSAYRLYSNEYNYKGGFGQGNREKIHDPFLDRFSQSFFDPDELYARVANDRASQFITAKGMESRSRRNYISDNINPTEKLPEDYTSSVLIDTVPMFGFSHTPQAILPGDFQPHDNVKLYQDAFFNAYKEDQKFNDPQFFDEASTGGGGTKGGTSNRGLASENFYNMDGSASGAISNRLGGERRDESYRENSIESMVAF